MTKKNVINNNNIYEEQLHTYLNTQENITRTFVQENSEKISKYLVKNYKKIRQEFIDYPVIHTTAPIETVFVQNTSFEMVHTTDINIQASNTFLKNIVTICIQLLEIECAKARLDATCTDAGTRAMENFFKVFQTLLLWKEESGPNGTLYFMYPVQYMSCIIQQQRNCSIIKTIYLYCIQQEGNKRFVESHTSEIVAISNRHSQFCILEEQLSDYVYAIINICFFLRKYNESDPQIILTDPNIVKRINRHHILISQITFLLIISFCSGIFAIRIHVQ